MDAVTKTAGPWRWHIDLCVSVDWVDRVLRMVLGFAIELRPNPSNWYTKTMSLVYSSILFSNVVCHICQVADLTQICGSEERFAFCQSIGDTWEDCVLLALVFFLICVKSFLLPLNLGIFLRLFREFQSMCHWGFSVFCLFFFTINFFIKSIRVKIFRWAKIKFR